MHMGNDEGNQHVNLMVCVVQHGNVVAVLIGKCSPNAQDVMGTMVDDILHRTDKRGLTIAFAEQAAPDQVDPIIFIVVGSGKIGARNPHRMPFHRSEEHTSELQSLMRISYAVFCLKKKITHTKNTIDKHTIVTINFITDHRDHTDHYEQITNY